MPYDEYDQREDSQPEYRPGYSYYNTGRKQKRHTGLIVVLLVLAVLTGLASWAVNVLGVRVDLGQGNAVVTIGKSETQQPYTADSDMTPDSTPAVSPTPDAADAQTQTDTSLTISGSPQSVENIPADEEGALSLQAIYEKVIPSVASISCVQQNGSTSGTGIVMSADGYVITNYHVIESAQQIFVLLDDENTYTATLVGGDKATDLAVLKVDAAGLTPAEFGNSDALRVGDVVVAIGDPLGTELRGTMTDGIVSAINRDLNLSGRQMTLIQTNAALNSGNSGGPLINCYGQVIGINTMRIGSFAEDSGVEGLGFAIPSTTMQEIVSQLIAQGYVSGRPTLGITGESLSVFYQHYYRLPAGMYITEVDRSSDAYVKGIQSGDILTRIDDVSVTNMADLKTAVGDKSVGSVVKVVVYRGGQAYEVELELTEDKG